jgi:hypothetical protein
MLTPSEAEKDILNPISKSKSMFWNLFPSHDDKLPWPGTQADFIKIIDLCTAFNIFTINDRHATTHEIAELFMNVFETDISPYPDFHSMYLAIQPDVNTGEIATKMIEIMEADQFLDNVLEGSGVVPSEEEQMERLVFNFIVHEFINRLSKFVTFKK